MNAEGRGSGRAGLQVAALGACLLATTALSGAANPTMSQIVGSDPDTCDNSDGHRGTMVLKGEFPALDAHGAALVVSRPGLPSIAIPYDPKGSTVPSFSYGPDARHALTIVFDEIQWCSGTGSLMFQVVLGGQLSNVYTVQIDNSD